jgi:hypothetical protein
MRGWFQLLAPLLLWLAHFFSVYLLAEFTPQFLRVGTTFITVACLGLIVWGLPSQQQPSPWAMVFSMGSKVIVAVAIAWQTLPVYLDLVF